MAWSHSYTPEAYDIAREELEKWTTEDLAEALAAYGFTKNEKMREWGKFSDRCDDQDVLVKLPHDVLVDSVMDAILDVRLCNHGGHMLYIDFDGWYRVELPDPQGRMSWAYL